MIFALSRFLLMRLMKHRAERHSGCRIDLERLRRDPEYASAIRTLARFTLDEELGSLGALIEHEPIPAPPPFAVGPGATVLPFRRPASL